MASSNGRDPSLSELERESEMTRAQLVDTVDELRSRVADTANDLRERVSPAAIKEDVKDYVRQTREHLFETIERKARENPLQAAAVAAGLAYPVLSIVRSIPAPLLLIGAGIALASRKSSGGHSSSWQMTEAGRGAAARAFEEARARVDETTSAVQDATGVIKHKVRDATGAFQESVSAAGQKVTDTVDKMRSTIASGVDSVTATSRDTASGAVESVRRLGTAAAATVAGTGAAVSGAVASSYRSSLEAGQRTAEEAALAARRAQTTIIDTMERHPLVVGGIGLAIGAVLAAALPATRAEKVVLGAAAGGLADRARELAAQGLENAKAAAEQVYRETAERVQQQGFSPEALREAAAGLGDKVKSVAEHAASDGGQSGGGATPRGQAAHTPSPSIHGTSRNNT